MMKCRNCGKRGLGNIQAVRAHLRFCPKRFESRDVSPARQEAGGTRAAPEEIKWPPQPYTSIPLSDMPGVEELEQTALGIGLPPRAVRVTANYLSYLCDLDDPLSIWYEMQNCPELSPGHRRMWLRMWCAVRGIPLEHWQLDYMGWEY